jgi:hypothetical protein
MKIYEILNLILNGLIGIGAITFACLQWKINNKLAKINTDVSVSVVPDSGNGYIKLFNTSNQDLYLHGFSVEGFDSHFYKEGRFIPPNTYDQSYYWTPVRTILSSLEETEEDKRSFSIRFYIEDAFGDKHVTNAGGEIEILNKEQDSKEPVAQAIFWTNKTYQKHWSKNEQA